MTVGCGVTVEEVEPEPAESDVSMALLVGSEQVPSPFEIVPGIGRRLELPLGMRASGLELRSADRLDPSLIELGNLLFFDQRLSKGAVMSCATCHDPAHGYSTTGFTRGVGGNRLPRTTPPAMNRAFGKRATWSGKRTLEEQSTAPITSAAEMGLTEAELVATVTAIPGYADRFERLVVTGVLTAPAISVENIQQAIATFQRGGLMTGSSPVDRFEAGEGEALSVTEKRGRLLFQTQARCVLCHSGPNYTDEGFHHIVPVISSDVGRQEVTGLASDFGRFKTPSLRNVALRGPYFHDGDPFGSLGMATTLGEVVRRYNGGPPIGEPNEDPQVQLLGMGSDQQGAVVAFLRALTGSIPVQPWLSSKGEAASSNRRESIYLSPAVFSEDDYLAANPDLAAMTPGELRAHWLAHGMREGRAALRSFHVKEYLELYPSVHAAFAAEPNAYRLAIDHYLDVGRQRGWVGRYELAPAFFNVDDYRALNGRTTALMSRDRAIEHVLTSGQRNHLPASAAPRGYFIVIADGASRFYYADGTSACTFPNAGAQQANRKRSDNVGVPRLGFVPPNLQDGGACDTTSSPPTASIAPTPTRTKIVDFECRNQSSNQLCSKTVSCPAGMKVRATRAACNLEFGTVPNAVFDALVWNQLVVRRASDHVIEGHCIANGVDIALGSAGQLAPEVPDQVLVGCSEHDDNGGDCQIRGQILCSE